MCKTHEHNISPRGDWTHTTSLKPPLYIEATVLIQEGQRSCMCVSDIYFVFNTMIFRIDCWMRLYIWISFTFEMIVFFFFFISILELACRNAPLTCICFSIIKKTEILNLVHKSLLPVFSGVHVAGSYVFCVHHYLSFVLFLWSWYCLSFLLLLTTSDYLWLPLITSGHFLTFFSLCFYDLL